MSSAHNKTCKLSSPLSAMAAVAAMENLKRAVRAGDMKALSAGRLDELRLELNEGVYPDHYAALHWACHYRNAEVGL